MIKVIENLPHKEHPSPIIPIEKVPIQRLVVPIKVQKEGFVNN